MDEHTIFLPNCQQVHDIPKVKVDIELILQVMAQSHGHRSHADSSRGNTTMEFPCTPEPLIRSV